MQRSRRLFTQQRASVPYLSFHRSLECNDYLCCSPTTVQAFRTCPFTDRLKATRSRLLFTQHRASVPYLPFLRSFECNDHVCCSPSTVQAFHTCPFKARLNAMITSALPPFSWPWPHSTSHLTTHTFIPNSRATASLLVSQVV